MTLSINVPKASTPPPPVEPTCSRAKIIDIFTKDTPLESSGTNRDQPPISQRLTFPTSIKEMKNNETGDSSDKHDRGLVGKQHGNKTDRPN